MTLALAHEKILISKWLSTEVADFIVYSFCRGIITCRQPYLFRGYTDLTDRCGLGLYDESDVLGMFLICKIFMLCRLQVAFL